MGFRFRQVLRLGKFARINVGKRGASLSVGVPGATVNVGSQGTRMTVGLPGTGLSYSSRVGGGAPHSYASSSSGGGCLKTLGLLYLSALCAAAVLGAARESPLGGVVTAIVLIGAWVGISRWLKRRRENKARALADAAAAEERRRAEAFAIEQDRRLRERWAYLCSRYGEADAHKIWAGKIWVGCTTDMMVEILGPPAAVDEKVLKTKVKRTFKYEPTGVNRYALRVFSDDGEVVGWEDKTDG